MVLDVLYGIPSSHQPRKVLRREGDRGAAGWIEAEAQDPHGRSDVAKGAVYEMDNACEIVATTPGYR